MKKQLSSFSIIFALSALGLVTNAKLNYVFDIKDVYKKITTITFNLENNE